MSSLAAQLAQGASLNANLLADRSRRKAGESYLFTGREADRYDLDSLHALGVNGLIQLSALNPLLRTYEEIFFSEHARATDRTQLTVDANADLDKSIGAFMALLGPYLMENPTGKVLEWLVRRFRINEFNVDEVLSLFLPYHDSPHFAKMVTILHVKPNSMWSFLSSYKSAAQSLPRVSLVTEMTRNSDLSRFVVSLLPNAIKNGYSHRVLLAFNAATLHEFLARSKNLDEGTLADLLPAFLEPLKDTQQQAGKDAILGSYILLSSLSHRCQFSPAAMKSILSAMAGCGHQVSTNQFLNAVVAILGHQPELPHISSGTAKAVLRLPSFKQEFVAVLKFIGSEKLALPLFNILDSRLHDEQVISLFEAVIASTSSPPIVHERATYILMKNLMTSDSQALDTSATLRLLSIIQQRYPTVLAKVASKISQENISADLVDQLFVSLSVPLTETFSNNKNIDMILASGSADARARSIAVKELLTGLSKTELIDEDLSSALLARVLDSDLQVLEALYAKPVVLARIFSQNPTTYISNLSQAIIMPSAKPKRSVIRIHLSYLASHLCPSFDTSVLEQIFHEILFPFLLFSKSRQHTAELVWGIIAQHLEGPKYNAILGFELISGLASVVNEMKVKNNDVNDNVEKMSTLNATLSSKIAQNIMKSNNLPVYLEQLLQKLKNENAHIRVLGYLITNALLAQLSGDHQIDVAIRILEVMKTRRLSSSDEFPLEKLDILESIYEELGKTVVLKPSSRATSQWLEISIIGTISRMPRPKGIILDWLSDPSSLSTSKHTFGYIGLMRQVYVLAHTYASSSSELAMYILQALFISLKDDSLAFLAGIWAGAMDHTGIISTDLSVVALRHGVAFLEAHILEDDGVDFQTILPSLLVALQSMNIHIRQGALECISRLRVLSERKLASVYRFDTIYGQQGGQLQYLDHSDCKRYLSGLLELRDHFVHDVTFIKVFYQQHLSHAKSDKKRDSEYKHSVLCYLLSHINGIGLQSAQGQLLASLEAISDKSKAMILKSTLSNLSDMASSTADTISKDLEDLTCLLLACLDSSVAEDLNDSRSELWSIYISIINYFFKSAHALKSQSTLVWSLENGLYASLTLERKITLTELLLDLGAEFPNAYALCKKILIQAIQDVPLIVHLLDLLSPNPSTGQHTNKRLKTLEKPDDTLSRLTLLVEVLASGTLPGSLDLISRLLETLNAVVQSSSHNHADVSYIEQLLMSSVENCASKIMEAPNISPTAIRLDILVEVIRVADNPQTFHQALLLIASIARLAPESVLHNVMPIFTFMGSNVFHRDDSHSFRVVQQTIEGVVPVMVSSLKQANTQSLELYIASKGFLRVFTDAAHHIPRHRRNNFFTHLVNVLGHSDFLPPICMLLIDKVTNRVVRQNFEDAQTSLALPIAVLHRGSKISQWTTLLEILREAQRLTVRVTQPNNVQPTFLEGVIDTEHSMPASTTMRRQAQALIAFVGFGLKAAIADTSDEKQLLNTIVSTLIALASPQESRTSETGMDEISQAAQNSLSRLLGILSAAEFMDAVLSILEIDDQYVKQGALEILGERLPRVSDKVREEAVPIINKILLLLKQIISLPTAGPLPASALKALKFITITLRPGEESSLTDMIPLVLATTRVSELCDAAFSALAPMPTKLGPRMIPYFRDTVAASVQTLQQGKQATATDSLAVMEALLHSIPTFWGAGEVTQVANLYFEHFVTTSGSPSIAMSRFMKAFTKKVSTKALLLALLEMWPSVQNSAQSVRIIGYFQVLTRTLRSALRPLISENLRSLFKLFLEALDIITTTDEKHLELQVLSAFKELVIKLNETAFRPLFRRLYDWAFAGTEVDGRRQVTFCRLYISLLDFFKGLMVPYMSFLIQPFIDTLKQHINSTFENLKLWSCLVETLTKSMTFDDGTFWRDDKLRQIASPLINQIPVSIRFNTSQANANLQECLSALADSTSDDTLLKSINLDILMHTRSEDVRLRLFAITCSEALWRIHGGKLLGFVAETTTFIAECGEDENDMVIKESFKLKNAVENVAGRIDGL